jgi:hypothetical protein
LRPQGGGGTAGSPQTDWLSCLLLDRTGPDLTVLPPVAMQQGFWNLVPLFDGMSQVLAAHPAKGFVEKELESVPAYDKGDLAPSEWIACHVSSPTQTPSDMMLTPYSPARLRL